MPGAKEEGSGKWLLMGMGFLRGGDKNILKVVVYEYTKNHFKGDISQSKINL